MILWDIEATNLKASFGYVLCVAWKKLGQKTVNVRSVADYATYKKDPTNDKQLLKDVRDVLSDAGAWVTWYGQGFDQKFVNSRLTLHGMSPLPPVPHIDGWRIAREKLLLHSNRLASVSSFLGIEEKTALSGPIWVKASAGDKKSLDYVVRHCKQDVVVLEQAYERIKHLATSGPNLAAIIGNSPANSCPRCGLSDKLQKRGTRIASAVKYQRFQCQGCGGWSLGKPERIKNVLAR